MSPPTACREAIQRLWDYLDGDLSAEERQAVDDHLAFCLRCCGELEFSRELRGMLDRTGQAAMPDDVKVRLEHLLDDVLAELPIILDTVTNGVDTPADPPANGHGSHDHDTHDEDTHDHDRGATT